jgi:hypothetical protein
VTVRHLLSHTAGTTVPGFPGYAEGVPLPTVAQVLSGQAPANTPGVESFTTPGTVTQYSGGGTTIVQLLVGEVTGRPFADLMAELVLRPFGMVDSAYEQPLSPARRSHAATGHDAGGRPIVGDHHTYPELQAAGLWTTAIDLARWLIGVQEVLRGDRTGPISRETAEMMLTPLGSGAFGLGPELGGEGELRRFGHSGGNEGFRTQMDALVSKPVGGVVLTNAEGGTTLCAEVRRAFADEYGWGEIGGPAIELADVDPAVLASYAGFYEGPFGRPMKLIADGDELYSPAPYGRRRMLPLGATTFLDEETGATLEVETRRRRVAHRRARRRRRADGVHAPRPRTLEGALVTVSFVDQAWAAAVPTMMEYVAIPARSPMFDPALGGQRASGARRDVLRDWADGQAIDGATVELIEPAGLTPVLLVEIPATDAALADRTV